MNRTSISCLAVLLILITGCQTSNKNVTITDEINVPATVFALSDLKQALDEAGYSVSDPAQGTEITIVQDPGLEDQGYKILIESKEGILIKAGGARGGMYGILDVAEQMRLSGDIREIEETTESPFIEYRGIKMNIALDGRLPSYDDTGDAAQNNIAEMWNMDFWIEFLDDLARNRYNMLTLWSKHPFPALCKLEDYPGAAMEDVYVYDKSITWDTHRDWRGIDLQDKNNLRKIKTMTMDEKIVFWQKVMEHAANRGIDIIWFTWNIFISPGTGEMLEPESADAITYMQKAVEEMVTTYPNLSGFGVTAGERMGMTVGNYTATQWMFETYGKGVIAAKEANPDRPFRFIFRRHHTFLPAIQRDFAANFPGEVETSYKYSVARMYSSANPPIFEQEYLPDVRKYDFKCWMNIRNDDNFTFRWGDPDFVREYLTGFMSYGVTPGFYMGSDGYLWGREFTSKVPELSGELEIKKHWYRYMLWGRLAYNPELPDSHFKKIISNRFPETDADALFNAWRYASKTIPVVSNFRWKPADAMWSAEGCMDQYNGFQSVRDFIDCFTLEKEHLQNITDYVTMLKEGGETTAKSPFQVADSLRYCAEQALKFLSEIRERGNPASAALQATLNDIECHALYGNYYAGKISGATYLHMYECLSGDEKAGYKEKAIQETTLAAEAWRKLAEIADSQYNTQLLARTRVLDWKKTIEEVEKDIEIVRNSTGAEPRIAKIFNSGYTIVDEGQRIKLINFLESKGYEVEEYAGWKVEAYATGLKIVLTKRDDLVAQFFTSRGGVYPTQYEETGIHIDEVNQKLWVIGETDELTSKGIDLLIEELDQDLK